MHKKNCFLVLCAFFCGALYASSCFATKVSQRNRDPLRAAQEVLRHGLEVKQFQSRVASENMANSQTPNYTPKDVHLKTKAMYRGGPSMVEVKSVKKNPKRTIVVHEPNNPMADANGMVRKPNLDPLITMMDIQNNNLTSQQLTKAYQAMTEMRNRTSKIINY